MKSAIANCGIVTLRGNIITVVVLLIAAAAYSCLLAGFSPVLADGSIVQGPYTITYSGGLGTGDDGSDLTGQVYDNSIYALEEECDSQNYGSQTIAAEGPLQAVVSFNGSSASPPLALPDFLFIDQEATAFAQAMSSVITSESLNFPTDYNLYTPNSESQYLVGGDQCAGLVNPTSFPYTYSINPLAITDTGTEAEQEGSISYQVNTYGFNLVIGGATKVCTNIRYLVRKTRAQYQLMG